MSTKKTVKKAPAKKMPVKKAAAAKASSKKSAAPAKKKPAASAKKKVVATVKKVQQSRKPVAPIRVKVPTAPVELADADTSAASRDFAYSIAEMMKRENRRKEEESAAAVQAVRLSRRPTTRAKGKETLKFGASDLAEFKKRLLQLRQKATGQSTTLKNIALEQAEESGGEDEDGSDAFLRLQSLNQVDSQNKIIFKIDAALRRIADGTYGICEICGQLIRKPRLLNMPFVHTCMECQCEMESPSGGR